VNAKCFIRSGKLLAEYIINKDGSVVEVYLRPAFRERFDHAFAHGINRPDASRCSKFNVSKNAPQKDILKSLFMTLEAIYGDVYEWPIKK